jgi:hypothetical protein
MDGESAVIVVLVVVNLGAGIGCAIPIAGSLGNVSGRPQRFFRYFAMLAGIYFTECIAFPMGMCTQVFTVGLAFMWGIVFGLWLRGRASPDKVIKAAFFLSLYTSLPTASFCVVIPVVTGLAGWSILSGEDGIRFGMPDFLPWPLNTILGFCAALLTGTVVLKTVITTGEVGLLIRGGEKSASDGSRKAD